MMWTRFFPFLLGFACLHTAVAQEDDFQTFKLTGVEGYVATGSSSDSDISQQAGSGPGSATQTLSELRTEVFVMTHSYVYHPKFLSLDVGGGPVFTLGRATSNNLSNDSSQTLYNFSARATLFADKPLNGKLFYEQMHPTQSLAVGDVTNQKIEKYGFGVNLLSPWTPAPLSLDAHRSINTGTSASRTIDDDISQVTLHGTGSLGETGRTQFSYQSQTQESGSGSLSSQIFRSKSHSQGFSVDNQFLLGSAREHDLRNSVSYTEQEFTSEQNQTPKVDDFRFLLHYQTAYATPRRVFADFQFSRNRQNDDATYADAASIGVSSAASKDLDISASFHGDNTWTDQFKTHSLGLNTSANHTRDLPIGKGYVGYAINYQDRQQIATAPQSTIVGELHTLNATTPEELGQSRVTAGTVVVSNLTRTQVFLEGIDYVLTLVGLTTRVQRLLTGSILDGQLVLVDYVFDVGGTYSNTQLDQSLSFRWVPSQYFNYYLRYFDSTRKVTSGEPSFALNGASSTIYGVTADGPLWFYPQLLAGGLIEREDRYEVLAPFVRVNTEVFVLGQVPGQARADFRFGIKHSNVWADNPLQVVDLTGYDLSLAWRLQSGVRWSFLGNHETDTGGIQRRQRISAKLQAMWRYRKLSVSGDVLMTRERFGDYVRDRKLVQANLRRDF